MKCNGDAQFDVSRKISSVRFVLIRRMCRVKMNLLFCRAFELQDGGHRFCVLAFLCSVHFLVRPSPQLNPIPWIYCNSSSHTHTADARENKFSYFTRFFLSSLLVSNSNLRRRSAQPLPHWDGLGDRVTPYIHIWWMNSNISSSHQASHTRRPL